MIRRSCGTCNSCCVAPGVGEIEKPCWKACPHLQPGYEGCGIYEDRPKECHTFECGWRNTPEMPTRFRPDRCGLMLVTRPGKVLQVWEISAEFAGSRLERWMLPRVKGWDVRVVKRSGDVAHV